MALRRAVWLLCLLGELTRTSRAISAALESDAVAAATMSSSSLESAKEGEAKAA